MDIAAFLNNFTPKQRITSMLVFGVVLVGLVYYGGSPEVAVAPPPVRQGVPVATAPQPQMPKGYEPGQTLRDPFAVPAEFAPAKPPVPASNAPPSSGSPGRTTAAAETGMIPSLNGVVGGAGKWMAILQYGTESRSYQVYDYVGPYQVTAITSDSVTVSGPGGRRVLTVGR